MNKAVMTNVLSDEERKQFKQEVTILLQKRTKEEIEMALKEMKKRKMAEK